MTEPGPDARSLPAVEAPLCEACGLAPCLCAWAAEPEVPDHEPAPEAASTSRGRARDAGGTQVRKRNRRGRRYYVARLRDSGLPRLAPKHAEGGRMTPEARAWLDYLGPLVDRLGLGRPVPAWAIPHLTEAGHSHLALLKLRAAEAVETHPPEARRLRSEARRTSSQRARAETVLGKLVSEHRSAEAAQPHSVTRLLDRIGGTR